MTARRTALVTGASRGIGLASWVHDRVDPATMISAGDIAELAACLTRLSPHAAIPNIAITRPGPQLWRA